MTTLIEKIIDDALDRSDITDPIGEMLEYVAERVLEEVINILNNEQGSMNGRHARTLAKEIKWKLTTDFDFKYIPEED